MNPGVASYTRVCGIDWYELVRAVLRLWPAETWGQGQIAEVRVRPLRAGSPYLFNRVARCCCFGMQRKTVEITLAPDATTQRILHEVVRHVLVLNYAQEHHGADNDDWRRITTYTIEKLGSAFKAPNVYAIVWALAQEVPKWGSQSTKKAFEQWLSTLTPEHRASTLVKMDQQLLWLE